MGDPGFASVGIAHRMSTASLLVAYCVVPGL
jgi:hypothetical protein